MKHLFLLLSLLLIGGVSLSAEPTPTRVDEFPKDQMQSQNTTIARMFVEEIAKNLPHKIDNYTEFVKIHNEGSNIIYTFEIKTGAKSDESVRKEDRSRMYRAVKNGICQSSMKFLEANINISYIYISASSKKDLFRFDITQKDCVKMAN